LSYALGESALLKGIPEEAIGQFQKAVRLYEQLGTPMEMAQSEYRTGVALARAGNRDEALRFLTNAYRRAKKLGARPLAGRIGERLEALGEKPDERGSPAKSARSTRENLTRRQVEVLRRIAEGLSNKEIAAKLYLSPRTVEMHAARVLDRLNCRSRSEAVRKAGELGLI
jgi:DNA-binding NarL/FixJ family response regulator